MINKPKTLCAVVVLLASCGEISGSNQTDRDYANGGARCDRVGRLRPYKGVVVADLEGEATFRSTVGDRLGEVALLRFNTMPTGLTEALKDSGQPFAKINIRFRGFALADHCNDNPMKSIEVISIDSISRISE